MPMEKKQIVFGIATGIDLLNFIATHLSVKQAL